MLEQQFQATIRQQQFWQPGAKVVVATSTGVDSMVLLWLLMHLPQATRPTIIVAHVNHELRFESAAEEAYLTAFCAQHQLQLQVAHWAKGQHPQTGIEAAAREFRYAFFKQVMQAKEAAYLVTAHHGDDQLETVLMKLVRSGELHEMRGIRQVRPFGTGQLIRPLLQFSKQALRDYAAQNALTFFEDQTNYVPNVLRNRMRQLVVPQLKQENPQVMYNANRFSAALTELLAQQAQTTAALLPLLALHQKGVGVAGRLDQLSACNEQQQNSLWQLVWQRHFTQLPRLKQTQLQQLHQLVTNQQKPQGRIDLGHGQFFEKEYQHFRIGPKTIADCSDSTIETRTLRLNQWMTIHNNERIGIFEIEQLPLETHYQQFIWLAQSEWPIQVRPVTGADTIMLDKGHHKTVQRLWIDQKVPQVKRQNAWALWTQMRLIGRPDLRISALFNHEQTGKIRYILCYSD